MNLLKTTLFLAIPVLSLIAGCVISEAIWEYYVISFLCGYGIGLLALSTFKETKYYY